MGSVKENNEGTLLVQEDFDLLCFDFVSTPSTKGAFMKPIREHKEYTSPSLNKINNIIRDIICDNTGMCKC
jgi:hypothetical protein